LCRENWNVRNTRINQATFPVDVTQLDIITYCIIFVEHVNLCKMIVFISKKHGVVHPKVFCVEKMGMSELQKSTEQHLQ